ncbi:MAG: hypothetical protein P8L85_00740 [Rubripirellula sp.]|nr:hypothetical protein [Rubripirellula sp.]
MNNRKKNGIGCIILAVVLSGIAINNTFVSPAIQVGDTSGLGVSRLVGAFLPAALALAAGLKFLQRPKA